MAKPHLLSAFLQDHKVASIKSSSVFITKYICKRMDFDKEIIIVEYGPGTGALTKKFLKLMNKGSKLVIIETNEKFSSYLKKINDKMLIVVNDSAKNVDNILERLKIKKVDYVISGIPFSMTSDEEKEIIIKKTKDILDENGKFFVYQFKKEIEDDLEKCFMVKSKKLEVRNIPPLIIFECEK